MTAFKILWGIDALACIVVLYFFFIGLADGSVSSKNMGLWMTIFLVLAVVMFGSILLRPHYPSMAASLVGLLSIPVIGYGLFILIAVFGKGKWN
ncbi:MAG: hypothetical protein QM737_10100 [Ferruginibacter sp.]